LPPPPLTLGTAARNLAEDLSKPAFPATPRISRLSLEDPPVPFLDAGAGAGKNADEATEAAM